jgi:P4 family phage/plasmid primase-like protien
MSAQPSKDWTPDTVVNVSLDEFLAAFYPDPYEDINLRAFAPKGAPVADRFKAKKRRTRRDELSELLPELRKFNETRGIYFVVNSGGDEDVDITNFNAFFAEMDEGTHAEQHAKLDACPIPPTIRVETLKSVHAYWLAASGCASDEWRDVQRRLIHYFGSDPKIKNPSRVMRVPDFNHVKFTDGLLSFKLVICVAFDASRRFTAAEMCAAFPEAPEEPPRVFDSSIYANDTGKYETWNALNAALRARVIDHARRNGRGNYEMRCPVHNGKSDTSLVYIVSSGAVACLKHCRYVDILLAVGLPAHPIPTAAETSRGGDDTTDGNDPGGGEPEEPHEEFSCSDLGNGLRFARQHGQGARYSFVAGRWFYYDAGRWVEDVSGEIPRRAKQTTKSIYAECAYTPDEERRKALAKHAMRTEADGRMSAMIHQAQSELPVNLTDFDTDPYLFNCANGVVDLRTGELREHRRDYMLTKMSPVEFDPKAQAPKWLTFLEQIFDGDESLIRFVQKAVGYSMTGSTQEQCLFMLHGTGANGKSVFLKTISALTADYGQQLRVESLMLRRQAGVSNDIACLRGARFLSAVETEKDHKLAEAHVKQMTGGDALRARYLFQEEFEFSPQFKIWLACNHRPQIAGTDFAIWRRIRLIPFLVTFQKENQNPNLDAELRDELPGILAWAVAGCLLWQHEGLDSPDAVVEATGDYRQEMDLLADFLADKCAVSENYQVTSAELWRVYQDWCAANGEQAGTNRAFTTQLKDRGFEPKRNKSARFWVGLGLQRGDNDDA